MGPRVHWVEGSEGTGTLHGVSPGWSAKLAPASGRGPGIEVVSLGRMLFRVLQGKGLASWWFPQGS